MTYHSVYVDCLDKCVRLQKATDESYISLKDFVKTNILISPIDNAPMLPVKEMNTMEYEKNESITINTHFLFGVLLDKNDKVVYEPTPKSNAIFNSYFFDNVRNFKPEGNDVINCECYEAGELKLRISTYAKESKPLVVFIVEEHDLSEVGELLSKIGSKSRVFLIVHNGYEEKYNCRIYGKLLSSTLNQIQKRFKGSFSQKQFHVIGYKSSDLFLGVYLSQKGVNSNITSAIILPNYFNEFDLFSNIRYLKKDFLQGELNAEVGKYRIKTPTFLLSAIDNIKSTKSSKVESIKGNTNPWICQAYKAYTGSSKINCVAFADDINNWVTSWRSIEAQEPYDINLDNVNVNWIYGREYKRQQLDSAPESEESEKAAESYDSDDSNDIDEKRDDYDFLGGLDDDSDYVDDYDGRVYDANGHRVNILGNIQTRTFTRDDLSEEQKLLEQKFDKLKIIIDKTLRDDSGTNFKNLDSYYQFLTYCLFIEEMFSKQICEQTFIRYENSRNITMFISTEESFKLYVPDEMHHLKKHAFIRGQPIYIMRKSDAKLEWKKIPQYWIAYVVKCDLCHFDSDGELICTPLKARIDGDKKGQITMCQLSFYDWSSTPFPRQEKPDNFAYLPGSIVLRRIFAAMGNIKNPIFQNLVLGKKKIKSLIPKDLVKRYYTTLNDSQKDSLNSVLENDVTIMKGPPGTGKTSTIYETVLQLLDRGVKPVMVVASSNLAVDNIAEKMVDHHKDRIIRVTSSIREKDYTMDHKLGPICLHNLISKKLTKELQDVEERLRKDPRSIDSKEFATYIEESSLLGEGIIHQKDVIFTTTASIGNVHIKELDKIPVIIMDEATQSSEPLTLIAMAVKGCEKIVLVGDPEQLSVYTRVKALQTSLFERVLNDKTFEKPFLLDTQYRMHPAISEFPRNEFYDDKLKDGITEKDRQLKKVKFPVFYYDHQGVHARESKLFSIYGEDFGYSWINKAEVGYVVELVEMLIREREVKASDIGVMTGYSAQRELLIQAFKKNPVVNPEKYKLELSIDKEDLTKKQNITVCDINGLIVASVDAFQGREKNIIVMSCVRSNDEGNIGFMTDERRMNVALTRARYSFILCGDAKCFSKNKLWGRYIESLDKKGYVRKSIYDY